MKKFIIILILSNALSCFAQDGKIYDLISRSPQLVYFGIDFSRAQVLEESLEHRTELMNSLFQEMNLRFLSERGEWMKAKFSKEIVPDEKVIDSLNSRYSDVPLMMNKDIVQRIIAGYHIDSKPGTGLVFIVTRLEKHVRKVELCAVVFDLSTKAILLMKEETGTSLGGAPGLLNYWYPKVSDAIVNFVNTYQDQKDEKNEILSKNKASNIFVKLFIDEVALGFETKLSPDMSLSFEGGYRQNYNDNWYNGGEPVPVDYLVRFISFQGYTFRVDLKARVSKRSSLVFALGYQHLYCPKVTYDPGAFAGDDDTEYDIWKERNDEVLMQLLHYIRIGRITSPVQFFYGIGVKVCYINEQYTFEGQRNNLHPSTQVVNERNIQPLVTFGVNIRLVSF
jgi:hypothetical protein